MNWSKEESVSYFLGHILKYSKIVDSVGGHVLG